jgi:hypothetical protein
MVSRRHRFFAVSGETTVGFFTAETAWLGETAGHHTISGPRQWNRGAGNE